MNTVGNQQLKYGLTVKIKKHSTFVLWIALLCTCFSGVCPGIARAEKFTVAVDSLSTAELPQLEATFTVIDSAGKPVFGLSHSEVKIFIDGRQKYNFSISPLREQGKGISLIILMQTVSQLRGEVFYHHKRIVTNLINRLAPEDTVALATYDEKVTLLSQLTDEKFRLHRELQKIQLYDGSLSFDLALFKLLKELPDDSLQKAIILVLYNQTSSLHADIIDKIKTTVSEKMISLLVVPVKTSEIPPYVHYFVDKVGGSLIQYQDKNDLWELSKFINSNSSGSYTLSLLTEHTVDYEPHTMTVAVEFFGFSASRDISYIGSSGFGINPHYQTDKYFSSSGWYIFFFVMVGCFCSVAGLAISEKIPPGRYYHWTAYVIVSLSGGLVGFVISRLLQYIP